VKLLEEKGVPFTRVDYYKEPFTRASLGALLEKAGLGPRDVLRKRAPQYKELGLGDGSSGDGAVLAAIVEHPDLLERPMVEVGGRAALARPPEKALDLLQR
jgi:arsenate reductase